MDHFQGQRKGKLIDHLGSLMIDKRIHQCVGRLAYERLKGFGASW